MLAAPLVGYFDRRFAELHEHLDRAPRIAELERTVAQQAAEIEELNRLLRTFCEALAARSSGG
jgi:hypothetical protein